MKKLSRIVELFRIVVNGMRFWLVNKKIKK